MRCRVETQIESWVKGCRETKRERVRGKWTEGKEAGEGMVDTARETVIEECREKEK